MELPHILPEAAVEKAVEVAQTGLENGEMPIGAAVFSGETLISSSYTLERELGRRVVHADLVTILEADKIIKFDKSFQPLTLAVNLEPCMMCMGAAVALGIRYVYYGIHSPNDGAHALIDSWSPPIEQAYFKKPSLIKGGYHTDKIITQFDKYAKGDGPVSMRAWALSLVKDNS